MRIARTLATSAVLFAFAALPAPTRADAVGEALRLVPPDTAICFVVRDLRTHARVVSESPFIEWVKQTQFGKQFANPDDLKKLREIVLFLSLQIGATPEQILDDVIGDTVIFAYQPGPPGKPEEELGVVIVQARKPEVLARVVGKLNELQVKSGEVKPIREVSYRERTYSEREKSDGTKEYYLLRGGVFAFSAQERAIRSVIDQDHAAPPADKPGKIATALRTLGVDDKLAVCWFNTRGFDAELKATIEAAKTPGEKAFLTQFGKIWSATDGIALYAHPSKGFEFGLVAHTDPTRLPKEIREVLYPPSNTSTLGAAIPADALFAVTGRADIPKWLDAMKSFMSPEDRDKFTSGITDGLGPVVGRDKLPALLAGLGPEWAFWLAAPAKGTTWVPECTFAMKVAPDSTRTVSQALETAAQLIRVDYNRKHNDQLELGEESRDGLTVKFLANDKAFPPEFRPSYAMRDDHVLVASSPEVLRKFRPTQAAISSPSTPIAWLSATRLRDYLVLHRKEFAAANAKRSGRPVADTEKELSDLLSALEAFERIEILQSAADGVVRVTVRVDFVKPLK